jgi:hypothetical protein
LLAYSDGLILQIGYRESHVAANSGWYVTRRTAWIAVAS